MSPPPRALMASCLFRAQVPIATVPSKGQSKMVTRAQSIRLVAAPAGLAESMLGSIAEKVGDMYTLLRSAVAENPGGMHACISNLS